MAPSYKEMLLEQWKRALGLLLSWSKDGVLPWGSLTIVADEIGVAHSTISRLWWQARGACEGSLIITPENASQNNSCVNVLKYSHVEFHRDTMGRVGATAITCTHRCRWFWFLFCFIVAFPCCFLPSIMTFVSSW